LPCAPRPGPPTRIVMKKLLSAALVASVFSAACADVAVEVDDGLQAITGGTADNATYPAVVGLEVMPVASDENPVPTPFVCTGTVVGDAIVLTSARCVYDSETKAARDVSAIKVFVGNDFSSPARSVDHIELYRYFGDSTGSQHEIALVQLTATAGVTPMPLAVDPLPTDLADVTLVGVGALLPGQEPTKTRRWVSTQVNGGIGARTFTAGTDEMTTCKGDSGGP